MTYWVNVYGNGQKSYPWDSRELAAKFVSDNGLKLAYRIKVTLKGKA